MYEYRVFLLLYGKRHCDLERITCFLCIPSGNVAYLVGDLDEAQKALEKALEIEPDNALFKNNLEQIKAKRAGTDR